MSALSNKALDRRISPRIAIDGRIRYRLSEEDQFSEGVMLDISQNGVLVSLDREIATNTCVILLVESDQPHQPPIEITAEITRIAVPVDGHTYSYGCTIIEAKDL